MEGSMSISRFGITAAAVLAVAASLLIAAPADAGKKTAAKSGPATPTLSSHKLEPGVWVAKVVGTPAQWNYVVTADPSGRHAAAFGKADVGFYSPLDELIDETSPLLIDVVMTSPDVATFNSVWYGIKNDPVDLGGGNKVTGYLVYMGVDRGQMHFIAPGKAEGTHNVCYYLDPVTADSDQDGFPDPLATPDMCLETIYTVDTRLGQ